MSQSVRRPVAIREMRSGFISFAENRWGETEKLHCTSATWWAGLSLARRNGVERTSRDKTGKEGMISTLRWCASARTAYSSLHHAVVVVSPPGGHQGHTLGTRNAVIENSRSRGRPIDWSRPRMAIITRGIKRRVRQRAVIEILFSRIGSAGPQRGGYHALSARGSRRFARFVRSLIKVIIHIFPRCVWPDWTVITGAFPRCVFKTIAVVGVKELKAVAIRGVCHATGMSKIKSVERSRIIISRSLDLAKTQTRFASGGVSKMSFI